MHTYDYDEDALTDLRLLQRVEDDVYYQMLDRRIHRHQQSLGARWRTRLGRWYAAWTNARTGWIWPVLVSLSAAGFMVWLFAAFGLLGKP
jgi:hypothetical protein